jgi:hypothetical protein
MAVWEAKNYKIIKKKNKKAITSKDVIAFHIQCA